MLLSRVISYIKKEEFHLDTNISDRYIIGLIIQKIFMYIRGFTKLRKIVMIGENTQLYARNKLRVGHSVMIDRDCVINALSVHGIVLGNKVSIQKRTIIECTGSIKYLGKGLIINNNVGIGSNSFLGCAGGIEIGNDTIIGNYVSMHSENHNYSDDNIPIRLQGVNHQGINIEKNCWIGAKVTILDGVTIEEGCIIAAGAVVKQGIYKTNSIYGGVPAKFIKKRF